MTKIVIFKEARLKFVREMKSPKEMFKEKMITSFTGILFFVIYSLSSICPPVQYSIVRTLLDERFQ